MPENESVSQNNKAFKLPDGRQLGFLECGSPTGRPVFFFHGWPGSRLQARLIDRQAAMYGIRVIGVDRPGSGLSTHKPKRRIIEWPDDVRALADAFQLDQFAVAGVSGGGPYALACAYKIPDRLTACTVISGVGPPELGTKEMSLNNRLIFALARSMPDFLDVGMHLLLGRNKGSQKRMEASAALLARSLPEQDRTVLIRPEIRSLLATDLREAFRQSTSTQVYEARLQTVPWGFPLSDINLPLINLWHGELDINVPASYARAVARAIPHCHPWFFPDEGHFSLLHNRMEDILRRMAPVQNPSPA